MAGDIKKKKITKEEKAAVEALESAQGELVELKGEGIPFGRCMVTRKITKELLEQDWFIFKGWQYREGRADQFTEASIAAGRRMGQIMHHRLQVRNDPLVTKQTRLPQGGLDRRLLANLGMDITSVFQKSRTDIHKPAMLHLTLDASGSMSGKKWQKVITVATALAYVGSKMQSVDTVVSIRGGNNMPIVAIVYDSRKEHFNKFVEAVRQLRPNGATPEGLAFKATMDLILEQADTHKVYFINFSDGEPAFDVYESSNLASRPTRRGRR
jgi:nitric oxide reductase activation protein